MRKITLGNKLALAGAALLAAFAVNARADCGIAANRFTVLPRLAVASMPEGIALGRGLDASAAASQATSHSDADPSIVGLWKTTFTSGGQVVDEGFDQWNSDGT